MRIIAFMGEAGSGKDTIVKAIMSKYPDMYHEIVSCTTRPPREGEQNGINYHFLNIDEFTNRLLNNDMLEATQFNGWFYGTSLSSLSEDKVNIGVFNPAGVRSIMDENIDLKVYYVRASDKERLLRQLNREINPNVEEILRRAAADKKDFSDLEDIPYIEIYNEDKRLFNCLVDAIVQDNLD